MTKMDALSQFRDMMADNKRTANDRVAKREAWGDFTDALRKDGLITQKQYQEWSNPF